MNERTGNSRRRQGNHTRGYGKHYGRKRRRKLILLIWGLSVASAVFYLLAAFKYTDTFLPNTVIGSIPAAGMSVEEVKAKNDSAVGEYDLTIVERDGREEHISGHDIGLHAVYDGSLEKILEGQNPFLWGIWKIKGKEYRQDSIVLFDERKLEAVINSLACTDSGKIREPSDAHLDYVDGEGLVIVPEEEGNSPDRERLLKEIRMAVLSLKDKISLEQLGIYKAPGVRKDDGGLIKQLDAWKPYTDLTVTYRFGSRTEVLDGNTVFRWLAYDADGTVSVDREKVEDYVRELAQKYNTAYRAKEFKTSYGKNVTITKGHYGWMIDKEKESEALEKQILSGESTEREAFYLQTAASHDGPDYGDTYVEINLTAQHLYFYKNGKLLIESAFVSGNEAKGWSTPAGAYELSYKQRGAVLKGKNYNTPVTYWMPFNGNIGMHDGYWRSSFGGTIYKKNGSHGCVNLPPAAAKTIFENIEAGVPVLCYHMEGTETKETGTKETGTKETGTKETGTKKTGTKETEAKETEVKETDVKKTETKDAETKETASAPPEENEAHKENMPEEEKTVAEQVPGTAAGNAQTEPPTAGNAQAEAPAAGNAHAEVPAAGNAQTEAPAAGNAHAEVPADGNARAEAPADGNAQAEREDLSNPAPRCPPA